MADEAKRKDQEAPGEDPGELSLVESIRTLVAHNARAPLNSEYQMTLFLKSWWSTLYNRPLKDPLLESYTFEELLYEFFDKSERQKASEENSVTETDKIEEAKEKEVLDWAEQEEMKELEEMKHAAKKMKPEPQNPTQDPKNIKWMEEQMGKYKAEHGESFGEDIDESFEGD